MQVFITMAAIVVLILGIHLFPYEVDSLVVEPARFLLGFSNEALVTICSLIIIGKALETRGTLQPVARFAGALWSKRPQLALLRMLVAVFVLSAFVNVTPIVVLMIPILVGIALRTTRPASAFMLPMGLATIIGVVSTTIGTSTNLLVVGITRDRGVADIAMFDITLPALLVGGVGLAFVWLVVQRLLSDRAMPIADTRARVFDAQLTVNESGFADGKTLKVLLGRTQKEMRVEQARRGESLILAKLPSVILQPENPRVGAPTDRPELRRFVAGGRRVDAPFLVRVGHRRFSLLGALGGLIDLPVTSS